MQPTTGSADPNKEQRETSGRDNRDFKVNVVGSVEGAATGRSVTSSGGARRPPSLAFRSPAPTNNPSSHFLSSTSEGDAVANTKEHEPKGDVTGNSGNQIVQREGASESPTGIKRTFETRTGPDSARGHHHSTMVRNESRGMEMAKSIDEEHKSSSISPNKSVTAIAIRKESLDGTDPYKQMEQCAPIDVVHAHPPSSNKVILKKLPTQTGGPTQDHVDITKQPKTAKGSPIKPGNHYIPVKQSYVQSANGEGGLDNHPSQLGSQSLDNFSPTPASRLTTQEINKTVQPGDQQSTKRAEGQDEQNRSIKPVRPKVLDTNPLEDQDKIKTKDLGTIKTKDQEKIKLEDLKTIKQTDQDRIQPVKETNPHKSLNTGGEASKAKTNQARIFTTTPAKDQNNQSNEEAEDQRSSKGSTGSTTPSDTRVKDTTKEQLHDHLTAATTVIESRKATGSAATSSTRTSKHTNQTYPQVMTINFKQSSFKLGSLQPFSGAATDPCFSDWVRKYKNCVTASGEQDTDDHTAVCKFLTHLEGRVLDHAEEFKAVNPTTTLDQLITELEGLLEHEAYRNQAREQFNKIAQGDHESVEDYQTRFAKLAKRSFGNSPDSTIQKIILARFVQGLRLSIRRMVVTSRPPTLQEAVKAAIEFQPHEDRSRDIASDTADIKATVYNIEKRLEEKVTRQERQRWRSHSPKADKSSSRFASSKCYKCKKIGHISKYCYDKLGRKEAKRRMREDNVKTSKTRKPAENHRQQGPTVCVTDGGQEEIARLREQIRNLTLQNQQLAANRYDSNERTPEVKQLNDKADNIISQVPIRANGIATAALIDTGSNITVAGNQLCASLGISTLDYLGSGCATGLGNNSVAMAGSALVTLKIGSKTYIHRVHFTDGPCASGGKDSYTIIIGNDLLKKMPMIKIDYRSKRLWIGKEALPLGVKKSTTKTSPATVYQIAVKEDITHVPTCMVIQAGPEVFIAHGSSNGLSLAKAQEKDPEIQRVKKYLADPSSTDDLPEHWISIAHLLEVSEHGTLKINFNETGQKTIVPEQLKKTIYKSFHENAASGGHLFWKKSLEKAQRRYYWPNMQKNFFEWTRQCLPCQRRRSVHPSARELQAIVCTSAVFEKVGLDLTGPLRESTNGNRYYINVVDWFTKYVISVPVKDATSGTVAKVLLEEVILKYGTPAQLISDNATGFTSGEFNNFKTLLKLEHHFSIPHHSRGNGATERTFRTFHSMVAKYINSKHDNWDTILPCVTFAYNSAVHSTTGESPFYLMFGRDPVFTIDRMLNDPPSDDGDDSAYTGNWRECITSTLRKAWKVAEDHSRLAQLAYQKSANKGALGSGIRLGDRVLIKNYKSKVGQSRKLVQPWIEGFRVIEMSSSKNSRGEVIIQQISDPTVTKRVHLNQIKKHYVAEEEPKKKKKDAKETKQPTQSTPAETTEEASADVDAKEVTTPLEILKPTLDAPTLPLKLKEIKEIRKSKKSAKAKKDKQDKQDKPAKPAGPAKPDPSTKEETSARRNPERQRRAPARYL
ncbi:hypothetical protein CAEBREN_19686 [Caenorhabditis brenneri]|uniref:RNA-directed DNA polymerase n=1 Tax=Caenorhabditis brenneri TaxID=135651 RepID=G0NDX4_CAEBE|nr:hypothetical protein CAEBREN_19686 [Caenorhabditis brenneri]